MGKEELRQEGFQFDLLNAPNPLAALMPKNKNGVKTRMGQVKFQFDFLNAPNFIAAPTPKTTANRLLILPATQANVTRHVIKCVAVIEKVYYLKNCAFLPMYINTQLIQLRL